MDKILIELYVPILNKKYDIYISPSSRIDDVEKMLITAISELSERNCVSSVSKLYDYKSGKDIEKTKYVYECKIENGTKLMLV